MLLIIGAAFDAEVEVDWRFMFSSVYSTHLAKRKVLMGSTKDPEDGHKVAKLCYATAVVYAV